MLNSVLKSTIQWFNNNDSGKIISRFTDDLSDIETSLRWCLYETVNVTIFIFTTIGIIGFFYPISILIFIPIFLLYFYVIKKYITLHMNFCKLCKKESSSIITIFTEVDNGVEVIRAYKKEKVFMNKYWDIRRIMLLLVFNEMDYEIMFQTFFDFISTLLISFFIFISYFYFDQQSVIKNNNNDENNNNSLQSIFYGFVIMKLFDLKKYLIFWMYDFIRLIEISVSFERILKFLKIPQEKYYGKFIPSSKNFFKNCEIKFENIKFKYNEKNVNFILNNISFSINDNLKMCIIGRTGCGKTTLIKLLLRLFELKEGTGKIMINGNNIKNFDLEFLRTNLTYISQNPTIFKGSTIKEILCQGLKKEISDKEIWDILKKCEMDEKIKSFKDNIYSKISENVTLSAGEKQVLFFIKTILENKKIIVLDEITSSIDLKTNEILQKILKNNFKNSIVITIAHRIETILNYDKILILKNGKIVDYDTPHNLKKKKIDFKNLLN